MSLNDFNKVLSILNLDAECVDLINSPSSIFYHVELGEKCSLKKFSSSIKEIEFRLRCASPLFMQTIPEKGVIQIQSIKNDLPLIEFGSLYKKYPGSLPIVLGKDYQDNVLYSDFAEHPHTLIAGTTGSGKSIALHNIICNALKNDKIQLFLSDSKSIEFSCYENHPKVLNVVSSFEENVYMLENLISTMETRFDILKIYNQQTYKKIYNMSKILVVIDELADLILQDKNNKFKNLLLKLSQKCRAAGIFIVAATQRPSVDILSGTIKANFPARIALKTASVIDSKVILDQPGAELLKGKGDAIINTDKFQYQRFRFPFINPFKELKNI